MTIRVSCRRGHDLKYVSKKTISLSVEIKWKDGQMEGGKLIRKLLQLSKQVLMVDWTILGGR